MEDQYAKELHSHSIITTFNITGYCPPGIRAAVLERCSDIIEAFAECREAGNENMFKIHLPSEPFRWRVYDANCKIVCHTNDKGLVFDLLKKNKTFKSWALRVVK